MKTREQLREIYRDLMGCKCVPVEVECVRQFVDYCIEAHGVNVNGGAFTSDGKHQYIYV